MKTMLFFVVLGSLWLFLGSGCGEEGTDAPIPRAAGPVAAQCSPNGSEEKYPITLPSGLLKLGNSLDVSELPTSNDEAVYSSPIFSYADVQLGSRKKIDVVAAFLRKNQKFDTLLQQLLSNEKWVPVQLKEDDLENLSHVYFQMSSFLSDQRLLAIQQKDRSRQQKIEDRYLLLARLLNKIPVMLINNRSMAVILFCSNIISSEEKAENGNESDREHIIASKKKLKKILYQLPQNFNESLRNEAKWWDRAMSSNNQEIRLGWLNEATFEALACDEKKWNKAKEKRIFSEHVSNFLREFPDMNHSAGQVEKLEHIQKELMGSKSIADRYFSMLLKNYMINLQVRSKILQDHGSALDN